MFSMFPSFFAAGDKVITLVSGRRVRGTVLRSDSGDRYSSLVTVRELIRKPEGQRIIWDVPAYQLDHLAKS